MRIVIQRVSEAAVRIDGQVHGAIGKGFLVLLGIEAGDTEAEADRLCGKVVNLRIFSDAAGLMNLDLKTVDGGLLLVSQFTLHAAWQKGNRPSFIRSARPEEAVPLYEYCVQKLSALLGKPVATGVFGADMQISLVNDGPVTILMDSRSAF